MKALILALVLSLPLGGLLPSNAETSGIEIQWNKKIVGTDTKKTGRAAELATVAEDCAYTITVANNSFKDAPTMAVKYVVFVERQRPGEQKGAEHVERVTGSKPVAAIKSHQKATVDTDTFTMKHAQLASGWSYKNGGKAVAKDSIKGVWVRVYEGTNVVAEYVNPSTIRAREQWKD